MSLEELKQEPDKTENINRLKNLKYNWVMLIISLSISIATILILLFDKGLLVDSQDNLTVSKTTAIAIFVLLFVTFLFIVIHFLLDKTFLKNFTSATVFRNEILETFIELEKKYKKHNEELTDNAKSLERSIKNLDKSPIENLISWSNSEKIELSAKKVWAITYNLKWLTEERINSIIEELAKPENSDREYHFIILKKQDSYPRINLVKKLKKEFSKRYEKENGKEFHFRQRFFILYDSTDIIVPLPNDVAIYQEFPDKGKVSNEYVVINTQEFHSGNYDMENHYDLKFEDNEQISRVKKWFEDKWNELYKKYNENRKKDDTSK